MTESLGRELFWCLNKENPKNGGGGSYKTEAEHKKFKNR